ncbi:MAG: hypothetical protein ACQEVA_11125 [Myxococcota bacterium]
MIRLATICMLLSLAFAAGCSPLPKNGTERALYQDLRQVVETRERAEWLIEYAEIERATPMALHSVCQVPVERATQLEGWITRQIELEGGPAEDQFEDGVPLRKLREELSLERTRALLLAAQQKRDRCPFYLEPEENFTGIHRPASRFVILGESVGAASLSLRGGSAFTGAGGAGRLLPAWGINHRLLVGVGVEVGGAAGFQPLSGGDSEPLETRVQAAVPLLFRFTDISNIADLEFAAVGITSPTDPEPEIGFRASIGGGVTTAKINKLLPYFVLMVGYQHFPWTDPVTHVVQAGTRFGFAFDP